MSNQKQALECLQCGGIIAATTYPETLLRLQESHDRRLPGHITAIFDYDTATATR